MRCTQSSQRPCGTLESWVRGWVLGCVSETYCTKKETNHVILLTEFEIKISIVKSE